MSDVVPDGRPAAVRPWLWGVAAVAIGAVLTYAARWYFAGAPDDVTDRAERSANDLKLDYALGNALNRSCTPIHIRSQSHVNRDGQTVEVDMIIPYEWQTIWNQRIPLDADHFAEWIVPELAVAKATDWNWTTMTCRVGVAEGNYRTPLPPDVLTAKFSRGRLAKINLTTTSARAVLEGADELTVNPKCAWAAGK